MHWQNFGDVSPDHGQVWLRFGGDDYAEVVTIHSGSDVQLADNQFLIERGSVYFSPRCWDDALATVGFDTYGPPPYAEVAYAFHTYAGMDRDVFGGLEVVQVGKHLDDWTASGTMEPDSDVVLHGNASIAKYLAENYLH